MGRGVCLREGSPRWELKGIINFPIGLIRNLVVQFVCAAIDVSAAEISFNGATLIKGGSFWDAPAPPAHNTQNEKSCIQKLDSANQKK